jgi:DNA-binding transcriptional LysR family regulator
MNRLDPLSGITVFVTAARADNFTQAAERLGLTKSAVGKTIAALEGRMGVKLFHRTTRLTRLTADGEAYLGACTKAVDEILAAQAALSSSDRVLSGRVHIDMPVAFGRRVLLPVLIDIARPHPGLSLSLTFTDATSDLLQDDVDIAIRFGALKDTGHLVARHLVTHARVICASPGYLRAHGVPVKLKDISAHRCVVGTTKGPPLVWVVNEDGVEKRLTPASSHQMSDAEAMVEAVVSGLGIAQFPISLVRAQLADGRLQPVLQPYAPGGVDVNVLWPKRAQLSPRVRYIVDQLVACAATGRLD